jgi:hypothetical protein
VTQEGDDLILVGAVAVADAVGDMLPACLQDAVQALLGFVVGGDLVFGEDCLEEEDDRPGAPSENAWWAGDALQVAWFIWGFQSLWMPASLLADDQQGHLADALFAASRYFPFQLQFSKGLAGAPPDAIARTRDPATNPAVLDAFALALAADGQGPAFPQFPGHPPGIAYPGIPGHEPSTGHARRSANLIDQCMNQLRALVPNGGAL